MADPKDPDALTEDGRAPVLSEDQAEVPPRVDGATDEAKAIDVPIEDGDFDAQPG